jgi:predicted DNA-binding transcriptional regulator YafY
MGVGETAGVGRQTIFSRGSEGDGYLGGRMGKRAAAETVTAIVAAFWKQKTWSQMDLARELELAPRTVRKHLDELLRAGWPLEKEDEHPHVFWSVPKNWFPEGVLLRQADVASLLHMLLRVPDGLERRTLLRVVASHLPTLVAASLDRVVPPANSEITEMHLPLFVDAAAERAPLRIQYFTTSRGALSDRTVSVQRVFVGPPTRFVGWCHESEALKWFRLDCVTRAARDAPTPFRVVADEEIQALVASSIDGYSAAAPVRVEIFVHEPESRWVERNLPEGLHARAVAGGVVIEAETAGLLPIARFVVGLGSAAECRTPELAAAVRGLAEGALRSLAERGKAEDLFSAR